MAWGWARPPEDPQRPSLGHSQTPLASWSGSLHGLTPRACKEPAGLGCRLQDQRMAEVGGTSVSPPPHQTPPAVPSPTPGGLGDPPGGTHSPWSRCQGSGTLPAQKCCLGSRGSLRSSWRLELPIHLSFSVAQMGSDKNHAGNLASVFAASRRRRILPGPGPAASSRCLATLPPPFMPHLFPLAFPFEFSSSAVTQQRRTPPHQENFGRISLTQHGTES